MRSARARYSVTHGQPVHTKHTFFFYEKRSQLLDFFSEKKKPLDLQGFFGVKKCGLFSLRAAGESGEGD
jgi:hypothetical protein